MFSCKAQQSSEFYVLDEGMLTELVCLQLQENIPQSTDVLLFSMKFCESYTVSVCFFRSQFYKIVNTLYGHKDKHKRIKR